jgi:hypothetical protein
MSLKPFGRRVLLYYILYVMGIKESNNFLLQICKHFSTGEFKKIINLQHGKAAIIRETKFKVEV